MVSNDFLLNSNGDLLIKNGDFVIGPSDNQHIKDIINSNPGDWQEFPTVGVGIDSYINGSDLYELNQNIKLQLGNDGYDVNKININYDYSTATYNVNVVANK